MEFFPLPLITVTDARRSLLKIFLAPCYPNAFSNNTIINQIIRRVTELCVLLLLLRTENLFWNPARYEVRVIPWVVLYISLHKKGEEPINTVAIPLSINIICVCVLCVMIITRCRKKLSRRQECYHSRCYEPTQTRGGGPPVGDDKRAPTVVVQVAMTGRTTAEHFYGSCSFLFTRD